jgi:hypothetical protein
VFHFIFYAGHAFDMMSAVVKLVLGFGPTHEGPVLILVPAEAGAHRLPNGFVP